MKRATVRLVAGILALVTVLVLLFSAWIALVIHGDIEFGTGLATLMDFGVWIVIFAAVLVAIFVVMLFLLFVRPEDAAERRPMEAGAADRAVTEVELACANCGHVYHVPDTGERPLMTICPECQTENSFEGGDQAPEPAEEGYEVEDEEPGEVTAEYEMVSEDIPPEATEPEELLVRCSKCEEVFGVPYTVDRPIYAVCPNCHAKGVLN